MTATTTDHPCAGAADSRFDVLAERAAAAGVGVLVLVGFIASYATLRDLAAGVGGFPGWLALVVPLSFDLGVIVLSLKVVLAARRGRSTPVLRTLVVALSAATVVANGAAATTAAGRLLHAVPPAMFVICFETVALGARRAALHRQAPRVPFAPPARWLLAPSSTFRSWRRYVLGGTAGQAPSVVLPAEATPAPDTVPAGAAAPRQVEVRSAPPQPEVEASAAASSPPTRLAVALAALSADHDTTAVVLAGHLTDAGHPVSVRTAQRIRAQAQRAHVTDAG